MSTPVVLASLVFAVAALGAARQSYAQDRVYVDQYGALRSELFIADADGRNPHKLVPGNERDYNASFSFDGEWVVFTSERTGSADLYRARVDGSALERLTDSPAFDDQGALSPDGRSLAFVSSRGDGSADIYVMDLASRAVRNLTSSPGGDFRPSWSPDGRTIAFSSDRGTGFPHQGYPGRAGKWEHVQAADIYLIAVDGSGLRRLTTDPQVTSGSPKWSADGRQIVFYEMLVQDTFAARGARGVPSSIVAVDVATGERVVHASGPGLNVSPQFVAPGRIGYLVKARQGGVLAFTSGETSAQQDLLNPAWSPDGTRVVYHSGQMATMHHYSREPGEKLVSIDPRFALSYASGFPAISPDARRIAVSERAPSDDRMALVLWDLDGTNPRRVYRDEANVMGLEWSRNAQWLAFGSGAFFTARAREPARIMIMRPDGSGAHAVTHGGGNAGFPSWSPDGKEIVFRFWDGQEQGEGLRIVDIATGKTRVLTTEYDTLPAWSPKGDQIMFTRYLVDERFRYDEFDIYSIRPDGTGLKRLTDSEGNDAHSHWSPDGNFILWSSSRFGFKDEAPLVIGQPQPYAELFVMNADGSDQRPLTDNQYEEGTPAWLPPVQLQPR
jgi:Tol biopolymer transport system component